MLGRVALERRRASVHVDRSRPNFTANIVRNVWSHAIIFCGHFPDQTYTFSQEEVEDETRGGWYVRQLVGAANIEGSPLFHVASGNLGYQVEHHLFPDMPSTRYAEIAPRVKEICERYELPYNTGPFSQQLGMVQRTILRLAFPGGSRGRSPAPTTAATASPRRGRDQRPRRRARVRPDRPRRIRPRAEGRGRQVRHARALRRRRRSARLARG